jgi:subtilisin family serine protease
LEATVSRTWQTLVGAALAAVISTCLPSAASAYGAEPDSSSMIVVKVGDGHTAEEITSGYPVVTDSVMLASHGIYLLRPTDPATLDDPNRAKKLAHEIAKSDAVDYAELNMAADLLDHGYHHWPFGGPTDAGTDPAAWTGQPAANTEGLAQAHTTSAGAGAIVAVLDTGVDPTHPALADRLLPGWDYIGDDSDPNEEPDGADEFTYGHGTAVAGVVALVAPQARILPYRVLDTNGHGTVFTVAAAIQDAITAGTNVINLSLGTPQKTESKLLKDTIKTAQQRGILIVAAAGNDADDQKNYPAAENDVMSVTALSNQQTVEPAPQDNLADFSDWGDWVDLAAPGQDITSPAPGGRFARWNGTSLATPFVAGQAALILGQNPDIKPNKLVEAITKTTKKVHKRKLHNGAIDIPASLDHARSHWK